MVIYTSDLHEHLVFNNFVSFLARYESPLKVIFVLLLLTYNSLNFFQIFFYLGIFIVTKDPNYIRKKFNWIYYDSLIFKNIIGTLSNFLSDNSIPTNVIEQLCMLHILCNICTIFYNLLKTYESRINAFMKVYFISWERYNMLELIFLNSVKCDKYIIATFLYIEKNISAIERTYNRICVALYNC